MTRTEILNALIKKYGYTSYLEIGVEDGVNLRRINLPPGNRTGVDPIGGKGVHPVTSDEFFRTNQCKFDLIFIDGLHHRDQVMRDITNSIKCLREGGTIMCHDMSPATEREQMVPRVQECWTGDCWKAWVTLRQTCPSLSMIVVDTDHGCGIMQVGQQDILPSIAKLDWEHLTVNRKQWLNLVSVQDFLNFIDTVENGKPLNTAPAARPPRTVCLTPTGDRPQMLGLAKKWFERSLKIGKVDWMVIDDGIVPHDPGGCRYFRREPDGPASLGRQLLYALPMCEDYDNILIWEDDDWYSPRRIAVQVDHLRHAKKPMHGWSKSVYYHLGAKGVFYHNNLMHSSLCETGFRKEFIPKMIDCIKGNPGDMYYDLKAWWKYGPTLGVLWPDHHECLGIKGGPGRDGYCPGHKEKGKCEYVPTALSSLIGEDAKEYDRIMEAAK